MYELEHTCSNGDKWSFDVKDGKIVTAWAMKHNERDLTEEEYIKIEKELEL